MPRYRGPNTRSELIAWNRGARLRALGFASTQVTLAAIPQPGDDGYEEQIRAAERLGLDGFRLWVWRGYLDPKPPPKLE